LLNIGVVIGLGVALGAAIAKQLGYE